MRSRNVFFAANGLRPLARHYHFIDSQQVDIVPKLCEIDMISGTFIPKEEVDIINAAGEKIGFMRIKRPKHKFGDDNLPEISSGLGSPVGPVEPYSVDPYDRSRNAPAIIIHQHQN